MFRIIVVVVFVALIIGTYVTRNAVANWIVCLTALGLLIRARRHAPAPPSASAHPDRPANAPTELVAVPIRLHRPFDLLATARSRLDRRIAGADEPSAHVVRSRQTRTLEPRSSVLLRLKEAAK